MNHKKSPSEEIASKIEIFENLCSPATKSPLKEEEMTKCLLEILTWIDENLREVNKEILLEILELINNKVNHPLVEKVFKKYNISYHVFNNIAFFIQ